MPRARPAASGAALAVAGPAGALGGEQEHGAVTRRVLEQRQAIGERVLARGVRELVDERFAEEGVVRMADRAPVADRHAAPRRDVGDALVGDAVRLVEQALARRLVGRVDRAGERRDRPLHPARRDRVAGAGDAQRRRPAVAVEAGAQHRDRGRAIEVVRQVLLARPDQLHRPAAGLERDTHRLADEVDVEAAAEAAADDR